MEVRWSCEMARKEGKRWLLEASNRANHNAATLVLPAVRGFTWILSLDRFEQTARRNA